MPQNYLAGLAGPSGLTASQYGNSQYGNSQYGNDPDEIIRQMYQSGFTQEGVNRVYELRGLGPAPTVPPDLVGRRYTNTRGGRRWADGSQITGTANSFLNNFNMTAADPYRKPSDISNLAGGVLGLVGSAVGGPIWTGLTAAADYGNAALGNQSSSSDLGPYGAIGTAVGSIYSGLGGPGSYGANTGNGAIDESGAMGNYEPGYGGPGGILDNSTGGGIGGLGTGGGMGWDWGRILDYGIPLVGGLLEREGAKDAASASAAGSAAALAENRRQYDTSRADMMPWLEAGRGALGRLQDPEANFTASPSYNFVRDEGMRGIENSFAARGGAASGNALRRLAEFNAGNASQEFNNWWNQQAGLAGVGQTSAQNLGVLGANSANNAGGLMQQQANARASGIAGGTNALTNLLGNLSSVWNRRNQQVT